MGASRVVSISRSVAASDTATLYTSTVTMHSRYAGTHLLICLSSTTATTHPAAMGNSLTNLPPEVMSLVLGHLRPRDLRRCMLVNSAINALVRPCFSRYVATRGFSLEVVFPLIKGSDENEALQHAQQSSVVSRDLSCLIVHPHDYCGKWELSSSPSKPSSLSSCRVLRIHLGFPDHIDNIARTHIIDDIDTDEDSIEPSGGPDLWHLPCDFLLHALESARIEKLVLRKVPVIYGHVDPDLVPFPASTTVREAVMVLDVDSMSFSNEFLIYDYGTLCSTEGPICADPPEELEYPQTGSIASALPPNVEELTFVFWGPSPDKEVAPSCCYAHEICPECPDNSGYDSGSSVSSDETEEQTSCWEDNFWKELAAAIAPKLLSKLRVLTIVNASGIVPDGAARQQILSAISTGVATHVKLEAKFRKILFERLSVEHGIATDKVEECVGRVKFMYMKDWILSTDWEDVFSWAEVRPWLEFKPPALITDYFKPVDPDAVKWRKDMTRAERFELRHKRSKMKRTKPNKYTWRH